jgi:hypothetical protein
MNRSLLVAVLAGVVAATPLAVAQPQPANPLAAGASRATPEPEQRKPAMVRPNNPSKADADARLCLEFGTNLQIIACAEKYR